MHRTAVVLLLLLGACKKKEPEPLPERQPLLEVEVERARFTGSRGGTGTVSVPVSITNRAGSGISVGAIALVVTNGGDEVCKAKSTVSARMLDGASERFIVPIEGCSYTRIGPPDIHVEGSIQWELGGETKIRKLDQRTTID